MLIHIEAIRDVLRSPSDRFYGIINYTEVAVKEVDLYGDRIGLVVVFTRENDVYHIVTLTRQGSSWRRFEERLNLGDGYPFKGIES